MMVKCEVRRRGFCESLLAAVALPIVFGLMHVVQIRAQSQAAGEPPDIPKYEVCTIKPTKSDEGRTMFMYTPDGISMTGVPAQMLLREAFGGVEDDRIIGAPNWVKSDRFDVQAKVDGADAPMLQKLTFDQRRMTLLPLLEDRFKLKFHHEMRELPVYALVKAKGGPKLKESKPDDPAVNGGHGQQMLHMGRGDFEAEGTRVEFLIHALSQQVGRTIVDKTGLAGNYDFTLKWTPDDAPRAMAGGEPGGPPGIQGAPPPDTSGPSLFTALEEQLGLKLESQKGPVDVIVIDHLEMPSEN
jgi:uncharacterized protein (TIGR03435 family)